MAQFTYVPDSTDTFSGSECLPAGEYKVQIIETDLVPSKSGEAEMVKVVYEVVADPQFDGRKIFDNIIVAHRTSADAVRIGKQKLNTICVHTGIKSLKDTNQLCGKTLTLLLGVREYNGSNQNTIKKYLPFNSVSSVPEARQDDSQEPVKKSKFLK
jgi:hypothetical protein